MPLGSAYEELELQAATDALPAHGFATLDHVFWRSSFGAPLIGGPTFGGNVTTYDAFRNQSEASTGGTFPMGGLPVFMEFSSLPNVTYSSGNGSDADYSTQRWNFTNASRVVGSGTLGAGAAAQAAWAQELLRTNHHDNGALTDDDPANGWQLVPDALGVTIAASTFQGFTPSDNASSLRGQAALILGLAEVVRLSDPAGDFAGLFDGSPFDSSLHGNASALLRAVANNTHAYHWDATAGTYAEPDRASVDTGDLALLARALAVARAAAGGNETLAEDLGALRELAVGALAQVAGVGGRYAASYVINGTAVTPDFANVSLWAQAQAVEALTASAAVTGLKADHDGALRASAGLESALYRGGSYAAASPEPVTTTYAGHAVAALIGALRDLSLTGEEPLAVYRFVDAFDTLVAAPPLVLSAAQSPPVVGAAFAYNSSSSAASAATGFDALSALLASYEFVSTGARFNAAVGGGVLITESAAQRLHNATAAEVGTAIDALDQQVLDLQAQLAALQAAFDLINSTASDIEARLNLSLINESISQGRIQDLIDNVTALRAQLNQSRGTAANATALYTNISAALNDTRLEVANLTQRLAEAENATSEALGDLNVTRQERSDAEASRDAAQRQLDERSAELNALQAMVAAGVVVGIVVGFASFYFINRFVMTKPMGAGRARGGAEEAGDGDEEEEDDS